MIENDWTWLKMIENDWKWLIMIENDWKWLKRKSFITIMVVAIMWRFPALFLLEWFLVSSRSKWQIMRTTRYAAPPPWGHHWHRGIAKTPVVSHDMLGVSCHLHHVVSLSHVISCHLVSTATSTSSRVTSSLSIVRSDLPADVHSAWLRCGMPSPHLLRTGETSASDCAFWERWEHRFMFPELAGAQINVRGTPELCRNIQNLKVRTSKQLVRKQKCK